MRKFFGSRKFRWSVLITLTLSATTLFLFQNCAHEFTGSKTKHTSAEALLAPFIPGKFTSTLAAGNSHSCVTNRAGHVYCWGKNRLGLSGGANHPADVLSPLLQQGLDNIVQLAAGNDTNCALSENGEVYCWGSNANWGLGVTTALSGPNPVKVLNEATYIDGDYGHFCAVMKKGTVKCWGNSPGVPGIGNSATPEDVAGLTDVEKVDVSYTHACAVLKSKKLKCWGASSHKIIETANLLEDVVSIDAGLAHACAVKGDGSVMCWGHNGFGQSGLVGGGSTVLQPAKIELPHLAKKVAAGAYTTCALMDNGAVACWGSNMLGQFGLSTTQPPNTATPVVASAVADVVDLSMGADHACALLKNHKVKCWGVNAQGQLGNGSLALGYSASPILVTGLPRL